MPCDISDKCAPQSCVNGQCVPQTVQCDDGNKCTNDRCDPQTGGCINDAKTCQFTDHCNPKECDTSDGNCKVLHPVNCDDGQACTNDNCDSSTGSCSFDPVVCSGAACSPGYCDPSDGTCQLGSVECDDQNKCTIDSCKADGEDHTCIHTPLVCDDHNPCTVDSCDPHKGCKHTHVAEAILCDDHNKCTKDTCNPHSGCHHEVLTFPGNRLNCKTPYCDPLAGWLDVDVVCLPKDKCTCIENRGGCVCPSDSIHKQNQNVGVGAGVISAVVVAGTAGIIFVGVSGKKSYDYWRQVHDNKSPMISSNPLYEEAGGFSENPLFEDTDAVTLP